MVAGVLGVIGRLGGVICGGVGGRVLFSESPPLMRKESDRPPSERPEKWFALWCVPGGWG